MSRRFVEAEQVYEDARLYHTDFARSRADLTSLREVLANCDTFDVVEVVRCKDCESWRKYPYRNSKKGECGRFRISKYPDGYCDEAVKREE